MADSYNLLREFAAMPEREAFRRGFAAAKRAVQLDDSSAEAHSSLAFDLFWGNWNALAAEREFQRALALDPNYVRGHHWHATALIAEARSTEALAEMQRARELDPTSSAVQADYALALFQAGHRQEATDVLKDLEHDDPSLVSPHRYLAEISACDGDASTFVSEFRKAAELSQNADSLILARTATGAFAEGGQQRMFERILEIEQRLYREGHFSPFQIARTAALLGRREDSFHYLEASFEKRESLMMALRSQCSFQNLRNEPAFRELLARVDRAALN
jgi:tetratricopeptide (TPR) repeat protein